ncbi:coiled-coil domain-containing protein 191 isoform X2 [Hoplias malabaricus]|uniref:coiled-coil domain-containing protein 191 isoform X2 n=1 Tax=Hoplias malabaricus TaxID=27720 RepID=UPI0034624DEE
MKHTARAILSDWMNTKLRLELEMDEYEDCLTVSSITETPEKTADLTYSNFDDMYCHLAQEDESLEVNTFLQELMECEVLDSGAVKGLRMNSEMEKKRSDPGLSMQLRHQHVKERRIWKDKEREKQRQEQEVRREAREEVQRQEREDQKRRRQKSHKQEELLQQEIIRLRREMEEKRSMDQLARKMERERLEKQRVKQQSVKLPPGSVTQRQLHHREQEAEARLHIQTLQCIQKHFSAWYSVVLEKRVLLGKAAALCDWRRQLRAWRAWRALVWVKREERESQRLEEELRIDNRCCQAAVESDRRRLLRRCLSGWRLCCRMEKECRELLTQQEETRRKMAALISAAASGSLNTEKDKQQSVTDTPNTHTMTEGSTQPVPAPRATSEPAPTDKRKATPTQPWQVTRRHAALSPAEFHQVRQKMALNSTPCSQSAKVCEGQFAHHHAAQQQTIAEQRRLLIEQQELISHLQERQNFLELQQEANNAAASAAMTETAQLKHSATHSSMQARTGGGAAETRSNSISRENSAVHPAPKATPSHPMAPHPVVQAMEERAKLREERRREVKAMKRRRDEEKLAQMKAAEEERLRQEEEEKRIAAERRKEERRQQRERELEKQKRIQREQQLLKQVREHYHRSLLLYRGLAPWKRLMEESRTNTQKAVEHHSQFLQRRCFLSWIQDTHETLSKKEDSAEQLYWSILLRRAFCSWKRVKQMQCVLQTRAEHFYRAQTLRKVFSALLDYATQERLKTWDRERRADEHNARRSVKRCFRGWRRLPAALREEEVREDRRERLRRKVAEILPDFHSSSVDTVWRPAPSL